MSHDPYMLPAALPVPADDGACDHLVGTGLPRLTLPSSAGTATVSDRIPYPVISDERLELGRVLILPTFEAGGLTLYRRVTLVAHGGTIEKVFYPVFPPDENADAVLAWLRRHGG